jgi:hypothetical protein
MKCFISTSARRPETASSARWSFARAAGVFSRHAPVSRGRNILTCHPALDAEAGYPADYCMLRRGPSMLQDRGWLAGTPGQPPNVGGSHLSEGGTIIEISSGRKKKDLAHFICETSTAPQPTYFRLPFVRQQTVKWAQNEVGYTCHVRRKVVIQWDVPDLPIESRRKPLARPFYSMKFEQLPTTMGFICECETGCVK